MLYVKGFLVALQGVPVTVGVTLIAMVTGAVLGLVLALMKMSRMKVLTGLASLYIEVIRGTPLIVQALIMAYGLPQLMQSIGINFRWTYLIIPAIIVCGLNSAAYVAEVIRSGIQAVDHGQTEAALVFDGRAVYRHDKKTSDAADCDSPGAENRSAVVRQRVCQPDQGDLRALLCRCSGNSA